MKRMLVLTVLFLSLLSFAFADEMFIKPIGRIPAVKTFDPAMRPYSVQTVPPVLLMTVGMDDLIQPSPDFSTTTTLEQFYPKGSLVYLYCIVANFDSVAHSLGVQYKLTGGKVITFKATKNFLPHYVYAVWIKKSLGPTPAAYQLTVTLFQGLVTVDSLISRFVVNATY